MQHFIKTLRYRTSHRWSGAFFYAAVFSVSSATFAFGQSKSITPDPYFKGNKVTPPAVSKPVDDLATGWKAPASLGSGSGSKPSASASNDFSFKPNSVAKSQSSSGQSGFGLSPRQQSATPVASGNEFPATNASVPSGQLVGRTANAGLPQGSQTRPKSLIVHAGGGSDSRPGAPVKQVAHQTDDEPKAFMPGKVLALVGGEPIFVGDLMFQINQAIEQRMAGAPENVKERQRELAIPQLLPQYVESKLLYQGAVQSLPDGVELEGIFDQVGAQFEETTLPQMMESAGVETIAEFDARLRGQNYSLRQLKRNWAIQQFTRHSIGQAVAGVPETTHQEMLDVYKEKLSSYDKPARAKWEQILVRFDRTGSRAEAKQMIVEIGNQIVHGANFAATAKKRSHDFNAASGGQHDWTTQGALALDEIDNAIFSLPVGELSDLIETQRGYHIVRVIEREQASRTSFLEAQTEIKKEIEGKKRKAAFDKYIKKLREEIPVEYLVNE